MKSSSLFLLSAACFLMNACATTPLAQNKIAKTPSRYLASDPIPFETTCAAPMDQSWPSLRIASPYLRDHPELSDQVTYQILIKKADGDQTSYLLPDPRFHSKSEIMIPGDGVFPKNNESTYAEYQVETQFGWKPKNAQSFLQFKVSEDWKKTDRAGICLGLPAKVVPIQFKYSGDMTADGLKFLSVSAKFSLGGQSDAYTVKPTPGDLPGMIESEILVSDAGTDVTIFANFLKGGSVLKALKTVHVAPSSSGETVTFSLSELVVQ